MFSSQYFANFRDNREENPQKILNYLDENLFYNIENNFRNLGGVKYFLPVSVCSVSLQSASRHAEIDIKGTQ